MKNRSGEKIKLASIDELLGVVNEESATRPSLVSAPMLVMSLCSKVVQAGSTISA